MDPSSPPDDAIELAGYHQQDDDRCVLRAVYMDAAAPASTRAVAQAMPSMAAAVPAALAAPTAPTANAASTVLAPTGAASGPSSSSIGRLEKAVAAATTTCAETNRRMANLELQWQLASLSLSGLSALQDVVPLDRFVLGRALAACVRSRLLDRLRACPPRRRAAAKEATRNPGMLVFEVDGTRLAMEQIVQEKQLVCITTSHPRAAVTTRMVALGGVDALAHACSMSPTVLEVAKRRIFEHKNGQLVTRLLLEQHRHVDGRVFYVRARHPHRDEVEVIGRDSEGWDERNKRYVAPLVSSTLTFADLPGLPSSFPASLSWRESRVSGMDGETDPGLAAGRLLVRFPMTVVRGRALDVAAFFP